MDKLLLTMLEGSLVSIKIFFLTLLFSLPLGLPLAAARMSKNPFLRVPAKFFLLIVRGSPLILQIIFVYFSCLFKYLFEQSHIVSFLFEIILIHQAKSCISRCILPSVFAPFRRFCRSSAYGFREA